MSSKQLSELSQAIVEQSADSIIFADPAGIIRIWNVASERLFGFTAADSVGQSLDLIIPERLREPHWRGYHVAMQSGATKHAGRPTLTKALHKSGETIYVQMSFAVVSSPKNAVLGSVAIARSAATPTK